MTSRRFVALLGAVALLVALGGCAVSVPTSDGSGAGAGTTSDPDPDALFESAFVHADDLEDLEGIRTVEMTAGNDTVSERVRVEKRPYTDERSEVLNASEPSVIGDRYVSNASMTWSYDPDAATAYRFEPAEPFDDEAIRSDRAAMAAEQRELYDLEYAGTARIANREAHVLEIEPKNETVERDVSVLVGNTEFVVPLETAPVETDLGVVEWSLWIDAEYDYPLKERLVYEGENGQRHELRMAYETVRFNVGLEDERFAFEPPENATVEEW
ncbi:LolA family protein [Halopiger thermotolerans]